MKVKPTVDSGALDLHRAATRLKEAVNETGVDSSRTHEVGAELGTALAEGHELLNEIDTQFTSHGAEVMGLQHTLTALTAAQQLVRPLSQAEKKARIDEVMPANCEWPTREDLLKEMSDLRAAGVPISEEFNRQTASTALQVRADALGRPQAFEFNEYPLIASPDGDAAAVAEAHRQLSCLGPIGQLDNRLGWLFYDATSKAKELQHAPEIEALAKEEARDETALMAYLNGVNPDRPIFAGLSKLRHPGEMKVLIDVYLKAAPFLMPEKSAKEARSAAMVEMRSWVNEKKMHSEGTRWYWNEAFDAASKRLGIGDSSS
jgi:hypothetical protein